VIVHIARTLKTHEKYGYIYLFGKDYLELMHLHEKYLTADTKLLLLPDNHPSQLGRVLVPKTECSQGHCFVIHV
jgi:hypothetical protein